MLKSLWPLRTLDLIERRQENGDRIGRYRITFQGETLLAVFRLTRENKIAWIDLSPECLPRGVGLAFGRQVDARPSLRPADAERKSELHGCGGHGAGAGHRSEMMLTGLD